MALCSKFNDINYILFCLPDNVSVFYSTIKYEQGNIRDMYFPPQGALLFIVLKTVIVAAWSRTVFARQGVKVKYMNTQQLKLHTESFHKIKPVIFPTWIGEEPLRSYWQLLG